MFNRWIETSNHNIRVEHFVDGLEACEESNKHILRVSVPYIDLYGHETRIITEAWIDERILNSGVLFKNADEWKEDQVPRLSAKVLTHLYKLYNEGKVSRYANN
jgi:hypothetical protein